MYAEELQKRHPPAPWQFSSQQEKQLQARHAINRRIDNALIREKQLSLQRQKEFLLRAEKARERQQEKSAKNEKLRESFRRALARRDPRTHTRGKDRDDR